MKKIITIFCLLIICLFVNSICTVLAKEKDEIIPLAVGNEWTYAGTLVINKDTTLKMEIIGDTLIKDEMWFIMNDGFQNSLVKNDEKGLWISQKYELIEELYPIILQHYPVNVGDKFKADGETVIINSLNKEVEVPAGKFKCILYEINSEYDNIKIYATPGIGIIKMINKNLNEKESGREDFIELKSYKLK